MICETRTDSSHDLYRDHTDPNETLGGTIDERHEIVRDPRNVPPPRWATEFPPADAATTASAYVYVSSARASAATGGSEGTFVEPIWVECSAIVTERRSRFQAMPRADRYRRLLELIKSWLADESGYDEEVWPQVKAGIEASRMSSRKRFSE